MDTFKKIEVKGNLVELDGDEMARIIWHEIKEQLILPFLNIPIIYYDLGLENRNETDDKVTLDAAKAIQEHKVGVKCATITPNQSQVKEFQLKREYKSPNGQLRNYLDGTIFREPIICKNIPFLFKNWKKKIIIGRHGFGDQYLAKDFQVQENSQVELLITDSDGNQKKIPLCEMKKGGGVALGMFNCKSSIEVFARACMEIALNAQMPLFLSTKDTIMKQYDGMFRDVFKQIYDEEFKEKFLSNGISYEHRLIDDMVAYMVKSEGGFVWACKNYDGDVQSDCIAQGFGSLGMMSSMLVGLNGAFESEAAHGTVAKHYKLHLQGKETSTNSVASIFAWTKGLKKRGEIDNNSKLIQFSENLEESVISVIENGIFTKDIAVSVHSEFTMFNIPRDKYVNTFEFLQAVKKEVIAKVAKQQ